MRIKQLSIFIFFGNYSYDDLGGQPTNLDYNTNTKGKHPNKTKEPAEKLPYDKRLLQKQIPRKLANLSLVRTLSALPCFELHHER